MLLSVSLYWAVIVCADRRQHSNFAREPPITPPPDPEANIARDRELEHQSRKALLEAGCPPCYPLDFEFPLQNVPEECEVVSYWQSLPVTGRVVLTAQLSDWEDFCKYQRGVRRYYLQRNTFATFLKRVRDRRRRHGLEGDVSLLPDPGQQSQLETWIEFQNYHIELHEGYEKDLQGKTEELDSSRKQLEMSLLEDPEEVGFLESGLKNRKSKLEEHNKMLRWIEQHRKAMVIKQATSLQASRHHDPPRTLTTPLSPARRKADKSHRSPLGPLRTAVSKQPPRKRRSARLQKSNTAQVVNNAPAESNEARGSTGLAGVGDKSSRRGKDNTPLRPFHPQKVAKSAKNAHAYKGKHSVNVSANATPRPQPKGWSKRRRPPEPSTSDAVDTRGGRVRRRPERLGFVPARVAL